MKTRTFKSVVVEGEKGSAVIPLPFDPDAVWGRRPRHRLSGTVDGRKIRVIIGPEYKIGIRLTPMWRRDACVEVGRKVSVELWPEGPQQQDLADDFAAALKAAPKAQACFEDLAQFYRKAYLAWINGTKNRPEERAKRIRETVKLLKAGVKARPR